jgi:uncharacterized membrane protein YphA (DoxX/SURF4 family)
MFRVLARACLSTIFVASSANAIQNAEQMTAPAEALNLPQPVNAVRAHGIVNLVGGVMLALGIKPRLALWALIGNLIPTTVGGHRFWEDSDEGAAMNNQIHFMKNVSMLGGLIAALVMERHAAARAAASEE